MKGKFQGSGCIVNPRLMALLCAGQRHHVPSGASGQSWIPEAITPKEQTLSNLQPEHPQKIKPFRKDMCQKLTAGSA